MTEKTAITFLKVGKFGIWQFFFLTIIAMIVFPGGTIHNSAAEHYSFTNNFFSDLGRTKDFIGNINPARWIFTLTLTLVGIAIIIFFTIIPTLFKQDKQFNLLQYLAVFFGLIAALSYIGIAFTPWDEHILGHEISVKVGFIAFFIMSIILTYMIYHSRYYPDIYGHVFVVFDIILLSYIIVLFFGPDARLTPQALVIQVICQKIVVYSEIICMLIQIRGASAILKRTV